MPSGQIRASEITIRVGFTDSISPAVYEMLLRPFWAEEYLNTPGAPGLPARLVQFLDSRAQAMARLEADLGLVATDANQMGFEDFLRAYESGQLPIQSPYGVSDISVVKRHRQ